MFHLGHAAFLENAGFYGKVQAIVIPDQTVEENKGYRPAWDCEKRCEALIQTGLVVRAVEDCVEWGLMKCETTHTYCVGYDQSPRWTLRILDLLQARNPGVRAITLPRMMGGIHTSQLRGVSR